MTSFDRPFYGTMTRNVETAFGVSGGGKSLTIEKLRKMRDLMKENAPVAETSRLVWSPGTRLVPSCRFVESSLLTIGPFEDWSDVRSRGRAARRRRKGHPQRIKLIYKPDPKLYNLPDGTIVGHPATIAIIERELAQRVVLKVNEALERAYFGCGA